MARDTCGTLDGRPNRRGDAPRKPAAARRASRRVRAMLMALCCALALQPSLLSPAGRGARAAAGSRTIRASENSPSALIAVALFSAASGVADGLRRLMPARAEARHAAASAAAFEPSAAVVFLDAPASLTVVSTSDSQVALSWHAVAGAVSYRVERSPNFLSPYAVVGQPVANGFEDAGLTRGSAFLYRVRAVDVAGVLSPPSPSALATAVTFLDDPLVRHVTVVKAQHVNDLRLAVGGVRRVAALPAASWGEAVSRGTPIRAVHVEELRSKLDEGLAALGLPTPAYTDATLATGPSGTRIKKVHFDELRARARGGSGVGGDRLSTYDFASARLDPSNRTGGGGLDPLSRNLNWSLPIVSLPGRAGLDLGLSLSYNSLVWTRSGDHVLFDGDWGWPAPGFRLGFPVVQGKFYDSRAQKAAYMLVTPSGGRVSLRRTATPTVYEAGDSSYLQLTEEADGSLTVTAHGGARMSYWLLGGAYRCTQVRDRHGNYLTAAYNGYGNLETITDTLGREVAFGYYADGYLKEITQTWRREVEAGATTQTVTETHYWARFEYEDAAVRVNFPGLTVFGPKEGQTFRALKKVELADESTFTFDYTTWGQVNQVASRAPDGRLLNYVSLTLPADETTPQTDCPRPTERRDWAAHWNGDEDGVGAAAEEAVTAYTAPAAATWLDPETGQQEAGTLAQVTAPDGVAYKEYSRASGWDEGLTRLSEVWADNQRKKWTSTDWTQDDEGLDYEQNPRVRETNVYDPEGNRRRTEVVYAAFALPQEVREYDANATTVLRRTRTEYVPESVNSGGAYAARRIIGLPARREVYGLENGQEKLFSKVTFEYDSGGEFLAAPGIDPAHVTQHDEGSFGAGFALRGNLTRTRRWDVDDKENQSKSAASEVGYNTLGSVVFTRDASGHQTGVSYADSNGWTTHAYPTTVTDPDGFTSSTWYNYDTGAVTKTETPKPNETTDQQGPEVVRFYDAAGRPLKVKSAADGAFTKWEYGASGLYAKQITKVEADKPETFSMTVTDGAGRVRGALRQLPEGYSAQRTEYDVAGRQVRQYNPVRVSAEAADLANVAGWQPAAEDAPSNGGAGWVYASTSYDWKGRPLLITNPGSPATTKEFSYGGCGCAGGEVVTVRDEVGRRVRVVYDALGRAWKNHVFAQQDKGVALAVGSDESPYSTTVSSYNARDQVTGVRVYKGAETSGDFLESVATYDGHGRVATEKGSTQDVATVYGYTPEGALSTVTDGRGAVTTYGYGDKKRHLVMSVSYQEPTGVQDSPSISFAYDAAGNRTSMTDGLGSVAYEYDQLSRLTKETRVYTGVGSFPLTYAYNLAGQVTSVTDPWGAQVGYGYDAAGRLTNVEGGGTAAGVTYAQGLSYRAWGALKGMTYGNDVELSLGYTARLQPASYKLTSPDAANPTPLHVEYAYGADGLLRASTDRRDSTLDRAYRYDLKGRLTEAFTGSEARAWAQTGSVPAGTAEDGPYRQTYAFDELGQITQRWGRSFTGAHRREQTVPFEYYPTTGRNKAWTYDPDGRVVSAGGVTTKYDAAGSAYEVSDGAQLSLFEHDGDGVKSKRTSDFDNSFPTRTYYLRSSVLGREAAEVASDGTKATGYVYAGGELIATHSAAGLHFQHRDASGRSKLTTAQAGAPLVAGRDETDPLGVTAQRPGEEPPRYRAGTGGRAGSEPGGEAQAHIASMMNLSSCDWAGMLVPCGMVQNLSASSGGAASTPADNGFDSLAGIDTVGGHCVGPLTYCMDEFVAWIFVNNYEGRPRADLYRYELLFVFGQPFDVPGIRSELAEMLGNPACAKYVEDLLSDVSSRLPENPLVEGGDILKIFDKISQRGGLIRSGSPGSKPGANFALGSFAGGNAKIQIGNFLPGKPLTPEQYLKAYNKSDAVIALDETMHHAGRNVYTDQRFAEAVNRMTGKAIQNEKGEKPTGDAYSDAFIYSDYWHRELRDKCKPTEVKE